jgi:hypothetical protein
MLACLLFYSTTQAQSVVVRAVIASDYIRIGEQTNISLSAVYETGSGKHISLVWPTITDSITSKIEVVSSTKTDTIINDSLTPYQIKLTKNIVITSFDSGSWVIPPFKFLIAGDTQIYYTNPVKLHVQTIPVDTTLAIKDIKSVMDVDYSIIDWIKDNVIELSVALLVLIIIIVAAYYVRKKMKNKPVEVVVQAPSIPPHIVALEKLEKLSQEKLWQQDKTKQYYISLTEIIRDYIEGRFKIQALEQTSEEILISFRNTAIDDDSIQKLKQILLLSDLVKFAKEKPLPTENELSLSNAYAFVNGTKREEEQKQ